MAIFQPRGPRATTEADACRLFVGGVDRSAGSLSVPFDSPSAELAREQLGHQRRNRLAFQAGTTTRAVGESSAIISRHRPPSVTTAGTGSAGTERRAKAKAAGRYRGRTEDRKHHDGIAAMLRGGSSWQQVQDAFRCSSSTVASVKRRLDVEQAGSAT